MSIINEIESKYKQKKLLGFFNIKNLKLFLIIFGGGILASTYFIFFNKTEKTDTIKEIPYTVKKGDIKIYVSGEGKIIGNEIINLNFKTNDIIKKIYKKIGDFVKKGEKIAELDNNLLKINVEKAQIAYQQAIANYNFKKNPTSESEINLLKKQIDSAKIDYQNIINQGNIDIKNAKIALDNAKKNLEIIEKELGIISGESNLKLIEIDEKQDLNLKQENLYTEIDKNINKIKQYLNDVDILLGISVLNKIKNDKYEVYLGAKNQSLKEKTEMQRYSLNNNFNIFKKERDEFNKNKDLSQINNYANNLLNLLKDLSLLLENVVTVINNSITSISLPEQTIENYYNNFNNKLTDIKKALQDLTQSIQNVKSSQTNIYTKIGTLKNDLKNKLILATNEYIKAKNYYNDIIKKNEILKQNALKKIDIAKNNLDLKINGLSETEKNIYNLQIQQAKKNLEEAQQKFNDSILYSPTTGTIISINGNEGEFANFDKDKPFVQIVTSGNKYIESFVEESDVIKLYKGQNVFITVDAIEGLYFTGKIFFVSSVGEEDNNGIMLYKVLISYNNKDPRIKNGMSVSIDFITKEIKNVLIVPVKAVKPYNGKPSVKLENGDIKNIVPGFTDGKMVEIISGLNKGDIILVSD